jgi:DNA-binding NtrC family response regulator
MHQLTLAELERQHLLQVLQNTNWNIQRAAKVLDISRVTVYRKMEKYDIRRPNEDEILCSLRSTDTDPTTQQAL